MEVSPFGFLFSASSPPTAAASICHILTAISDRLLEAAAFAHALPRRVAFAEPASPAVTDGPTETACANHCKDKHGKARY